VRLVASPVVESLAEGMRQRLLSCSMRWWVGALLSLASLSKLLIFSFYGALFGVLGGVVDSLRTSKVKSLWRRVD
jgi:hypothetical protein